MASRAAWQKKHKICQCVFPLFLLSFKDRPTHLPICPFNSPIILCTQILSSVVHLGYIHAALYGQTNSSIHRLKQ